MLFTWLESFPEEFALSQFSREFFAVADEDFVLLLLSTFEDMFILDECFDMFSVCILHVIRLREIVDSKDCRLARDFLRLSMERTLLMIKVGKLLYQQKNKRKGEMILQ